MKRIISLITIMALLIGIMMPTSVSAQAATKVDLKKAIEIAKSNFNFDTKGLDFNQSYNENNGRKVWSLNWNSRKAPYRSMSVSVDADTGEITNMYCWDDNQAGNVKLPKYTKEDAKKVAKDLASKLQPNKFKETKEYEDINVRLYGDSYYGGDVYRITYARYINGILFQDNGINVSIDKNTLKVRNYEYNWDNVKLPELSKAIKEDAAKKIFTEKIGMELRYSMVYNDKLQKNVPILVYALKNGNKPIDAITGELINNGGYYGGGYGFAEKAGLSSAQKDIDMTPQEQKVVDETDKYITKEKALEIASKYVKVPEGYKMDNANLYGGFPSGFATWNFSWNMNDSAKSLYGYISVSVDAVTGELTSFYRGGTDIDGPTDKDPKYTKEQTKEIADKYIASIQPDKAKQLEYRDNMYEYISPTQKVSSYNLNYMRIVNGIPCFGDGINVTVSTRNGEVIGYNKTWSTDKFPEIGKTISLEQAYASLYKNLKFELKYIRYYDYSKQYSGSDAPEIKLVYMLEPSAGIISPVTGDLLDNNGDPVKPVSNVKFTDIKGHTAEKDILTLVDMKIISVDSDKFMPDSKILQKDFIKMLMKSLEPMYYTAASNDSDYDQYYQQAISRKILSEKEKNENAVVTKQQAAKMVVRALGAGFVADMSNLYTLSFNDAKNINSSYKGYVAIASELKILTAEKSYFSPAKELTKADAATVMIQFLKTDLNPKE